MQVDYAQLSWLARLGRPRDAALGTRLQRRLALVAVAQPRLDARFCSRQIGREQLELTEWTQYSVDFIGDVG